MNIDITPINGRAVWPLFAPHHYLTAKYVGHRAYLATLSDGTPVAFTSSISFPHGSIRNGWREHRTVVLPDFQGLGIGARLSDWLGAEIVGNGGRFYSTTSHPRLGAYRDLSPLWKPTSRNRKSLPERDATSQGLGGGAWGAVTGRVRFSHEYIGGS